MANTSAKGRLKANAARLKILREVILGTNAVFAVVRGGAFYRSFSVTTGSVWAIFCVLYAVAYAFLATGARPTYSGTTLIDGGDDISAPGLNEYAHDTIYVTALAHLGTIISPYFVLLLAIMPIYGIYSICVAGSTSASLAESQTAADDSRSNLAGLSRKERRQAERGTSSRKQF
jgi:SRP-independent targeting protein 2/TMEM208